MQTDLGNVEARLVGLAPIPYKPFIDQMGISGVTGWKWRRKGFLSTVNISGHLYITPQAAQEFLVRAQRGDFARAPAGCAAPKPAVKGTAA